MSAMAVMSGCRAENLAITVQDIMACKSIPHLASKVTLPEKNSYEEDDQEFNLSPIQRLYFQCMQGRQTQFNQSMLLYLRRPAQAEDLRRAIHELVKTHSMLRARFFQNKDRYWRQQISKDIDGSYKFQVFKLEKDAQLQDFINNTQKSIDVVNGPSIAVDLFDFGSEQTLFIAVHHLVVDVVSWNIMLQDLEDLLRFKTIQGPNTTPFQNWCRLQKENAQRNTSKDVLPIDDVPAANISYWGMQAVPNNYGLVVTEEVQLQTNISQNLLSACHKSQQIEFIDVVLAALLASFSHVFTDRATLPAIYNEGHGREPWNPSLDVSRTIGWFTTLSPVHLPRGHDICKGKN
jgi:hypothetical protein